MIGAAFFRLALTFACSQGIQDPAVDGAPKVALVVNEGRPLRVSLDTRIRVKRAGQPVTATLIEPLYVYDRVVIPAGTRVLGHIEELARVATGARVVGILRLDFSPPRRVALQFDRLVLADGREIPLATRVGPGTADVVMQTADEVHKTDVVSRAGAALASDAKSAADAVRRPGRMSRFKHWLVMSLPFHPQYLAEGTVYDAELLEPVDFGLAEPVQRAPTGTPAPPDSVLSARLVTGIDSARSGRGTTIGAVLTRPLLSADQQLILPEGTTLTGEVTYAKPARWLRRNGQLRLVFDGLSVPNEPPETLVASLRSAEVARGARLAIDDEGGASITNPAARFVAPTLALGALAATQLMEPVTEPGTIEPGVPPGAMEPSSLGSAASGFSGLRLPGIALGLASHTAAVGLGVVGLAGSIYASYIGKGREVSFPAGTRMQLQMAPGPAPEHPAPMAKQP